MPTTSYSRSPYHNKLPRTIITTTRSIQERRYLPLSFDLYHCYPTGGHSERSNPSSSSNATPPSIISTHSSHQSPIDAIATGRLRRCPMAMRDTRRATDTYLVLEGRRGSSNTASGRENLAIGQYALPRHLNLRGMAFSSPLLCSTAPYLSQ